MRQVDGSSTRLYPKRLMQRVDVGIAKQGMLMLGTARAMYDDAGPTCSNMLQGVGETGKPVECSVLCRVPLLSCTPGHASEANPCSPPGP